MCNKEETKDELLLNGRATVLVSVPCRVVTALSCFHLGAIIVNAINNSPIVGHSFRPTMAEYRLFVTVAQGPVGHWVAHPTGQCFAMPQGNMVRGALSCARW